jgi:lysophospholipase L1-like esterase
MNRFAAILAATALAAFAVAGTGAGTATAATTTLRLMPLGDSITWGDHSSTGNGYRGPLWDDLAGEGHALDFVGTGRNGTMSDPDNEGHSGYRIDQIATIVDATVGSYRPNVVTLEIGTNDLNQDYQVGTAPARLSSLIDQITADAPDATVLVASVIVSTSPVEEANRAAYNQQIPGIVQAKQSAGKHVAYVDMSSLTPADLYDTLHPNDGGHKKMADAFNGGVQAADAAGWLNAPVPAGPITSRLNTGKCVDDYGYSSDQNTAKVDIYDCNTSAAQRWAVWSDHTLRIHGLCMDALGANPLNSTKVGLWTCNGGTNQQWFAQPDGSLQNGMKDPTSHPLGLCLDDPSYVTDNGTQLIIWDCNGGTNQKWTMP